MENVQGSHRRVQITLKLENDVWTETNWKWDRETGFGLYILFIPFSRRWLPGVPQSTGSKLRPASKLWMHQPLHWTVNHKENDMASLTIHFWAPSCQNRVLPSWVLCKCSFEQSDCLRLFIKSILMSVKCLNLKWDMKSSFS